MKERPTNCPNCGAILTSGKCEYCGSVVCPELYPDAECDDIKPLRGRKATVNENNAIQSVDRAARVAHQLKYGVRDCSGKIWYYKDETGQQLTADEILKMLDEQQEGTE